MNTAEYSQQYTTLTDHYDELMESVPYAAWADYVFLLLEVAAHKPSRVLDCACGTGNVAYELARAGVHVTGVDLSSGMVEVANSKRGLEYPGVEFYQGDLTDFNLGTSFDTATCLYDSFNYILDKEDLGRAFGCIGKHLHRGGVFVFDLNTPHAFEADLFTQKSFTPRTNLQYDWKALYDVQTKICTVQMQFERKDENGAIETFNEVHRERAYSLEEIEELLHENGWQLLNSYDAYTLNPARARSERWFFVARKT